MCFNPFDIIRTVFQTIFGGGPQKPPGPTTHQRGLANRLRRPGQETQDQNLEKDKEKTETDLSQAQSDALKRTADSNQQTGKTDKTQADLIAALSGVTDAPTGGVTAPTDQPRGGGGTGY